MRLVVAQKMRTVREIRVVRLEVVKPFRVLLGKFVAGKSVSTHKPTHNIVGGVAVLAWEATPVKKVNVVVRTDKRNAMVRAWIQHKATHIAGRVKMLVGNAKSASKASALAEAISSNVAEIVQISTATTNTAEAAVSLAKVTRPAKTGPAPAKIPAVCVVVFVLISSRTANIAEDATKHATPTKSNVREESVCVLLRSVCAAVHVSTHKALFSIAGRAVISVALGKSAKGGDVCRWLPLQQGWPTHARSRAVANSNVGVVTTKMCWGNPHL